MGTCTVQFSTVTKIEMNEEGIDVRDIFGVIPLDDLEFSSSDLVKRDINCAVDLFAAFPKYGDYKIFSTRAHQGVYDIILSQALNLSRNKYVNSQGESSSTMVGVKGIGKTTSLKTFAHICKYIVPGVHVLYVSFNNIMANTWLRNESLTKIIVKELEELGVQIDVPSDCRSLNEHLVRVLKKKKMRLMLLIDELDQLYKLKLDVCLETLHDLAYIGNQPSGTLSTIVCGSSSMMGFLITANGGANVRAEFPLLDLGAPNLNATKFLTKRVYSNIPTDLSAVAEQADVNLDEKTSIFWVRLVAFSAGVSARAVGRLLHDSGLPGEILASLSPDSALSNSDVKLLRDKIIRKIYKKNIDLFNALLKSGDIVMNIATTDWETRFEPLKYAEVQKIWKLLINRGEVPKENSGSLDDNLLHLGDRGWLTIGAIENSHPENIYPYSMFYCFKEQMRAEAVSDLRNKIVSNVRKGCAGFTGYVGNPRIVAVAGGTAAAFGCNVM